MNTPSDMSKRATAGELDAKQRLQIIQSWSDALNDAHNWTSRVDATIHDVAAIKIELTEMKLHLFDVQSRVAALERE